MKVSWDYEIPNIWKNKIHIPNHQPVHESIFSWNAKMSLGASKISHE